MCKIVIKTKRKNYSAANWLVLDLIENFQKWDFHLCTKCKRPEWYFSRSAQSAHTHTSHRHRHRRRECDKSFLAANYIDVPSKVNRSDVCVAIVQVAFQFTFYSQSFQKFPETQIRLENLFDSYYYPTPSNRSQSRLNRESNLLGTFNGSCATVYDDAFQMQKRSCQRPHAKSWNLIISVIPWFVFVLHSDSDSSKFKYNLKW